MKETDCNSDFNLIANNFQLLIDNTARILSTPSMVNGKHCLSAEFAFGGIVYFPISSLLKAWKEGHWKTSCSNSNEHEAFILSGASLMSDGIIKAYCPHCDKLYTRAEPFLKDYAYMAMQTHGDEYGLSLPEIISVLRADGK